MNNLEELSFFEELLKTSKNELVKKALDQGRVAIGYNCYVVPEPLISAGNIFPLWMRAPEIADTTQADYHLSSVVCSYAKSILQAGLEGEYDFLGGMVFAASCDHIRRSGQHFELQKINGDNEKFFVYMLDTPHKVNEAVVNWLARDMRKVAEKLNNNYNAGINDDTLRKSIKEFNEFNVLLKSICDMRKEENPRITGTEWHIIYGATKVAPKDMLIEPLKKIKAEIEARAVEQSEKVKLMIVGSTIDNPEFIKLIEDQGAVVVADRFCFGSLPGMEHIAEDGDPFVSLANYYMDTCMCPRMMEKPKDRIEYSKDIAKEYGVQGIIFDMVKFCDLWSYEGLSYIKGMKATDMPVVKIEREYGLTGEGQFRTRVQAFIESINTKK